MRDMKQSILLFAMLVFLVGCGKKAEAAAPQSQPMATPKAQSKATSEAQPKAKEAKKAETATLKDAVNPWETPTRLALFMAQKIERADFKAKALRAVASAQVEAGDKEQALATLKQAVEAAQKIHLPGLTMQQRASFKQSALRNIAMALATEPILENKKDNSNRSVERRMKKAFTPKEKQLAKQLVEAVQGN